MHSDPLLQSSQNTVPLSHVKSMLATDAGKKWIVYFAPKTDTSGHSEWKVFKSEGEVRAEAAKLQSSGHRVRVEYGEEL